jgi:hypothetical protein
MLVRGYFVTLYGFEPPLPQGECASCGAPAERAIRVGRGLTAPYCATCAGRTRFWARFVLTSLVIAVAGLVVVVGSFYASFVPLWVADVAPPILLGGAALAYGIRRETQLPENGATTQRDAVRLLRPWPPWFFCSNERFMKRLVDAHGGTAAPGTQRQWDVAWSAITAAGTLLGVTWFGFVVNFNGAIMIDNGGRARATIWLDGKRVADVAAGDHEKISLRPGRHTLAWSTGSKPEHERSFDLTASHEYLYNPGATTCYWRSVEIYQKRGPARDVPKEAADDGPLAIQELYDLPKVDRWFEPNPGEKSVSSGDSYETDYAIVRDTKCSQLIADGCKKSVLDQLLECEAKARTAPDVNDCAAKARASCDAH